MHLTTAGLGKRFSGSWVFRNIDCTIHQGARAAVTGRNGSGKSTFLHILSGMMPATEGWVTRKVDGKAIEEDNCFPYLSFTAPYQLLPEQFSAYEVADQWRKMKPFREKLPSSELLERAGLDHTGNKPIAKFSSGMKTRLKLALALYSEVSLMVLDEPASNLDQQGMEWYLHTIEQVPLDTTIVVASNIPAEYSYCTQTIAMYI